MIIDYMSMLVIACKKVMVIKLMYILCANNNYSYVKSMISNKHLVMRVCESFILAKKIPFKVINFLLLFQYLKI